MSSRLTLILGGARAGKSSLAQRIASECGGRVLFLATAEPLDDDMAARIARHQADRPGSWRTIEEPLNLVDALTPFPRCDIVLLDCLTLWVSNLLMRDESTDASLEAVALLEHIAANDAQWIVVSNEVGLGIVPDSVLGRRFADELGRVNQLFAAAADDVAFVAAGLPIWLKGGPGSS